MHIVIGILGALQIIAGLLMLVGSRSAMHETTAATAFGLGVLSLAAAIAIAELRSIGRRIDAREAGDVDRHTTQEKIASAFDRIGRKTS